MSNSVTSTDVIIVGTGAAGNVFVNNLFVAFGVVRNLVRYFLRNGVEIDNIL